MIICRYSFTQWISLVCQGGYAFSCTCGTISQELYCYFCYSPTRVPKLAVKNSPVMGWGDFSNMACIKMSKYVQNMSTRKLPKWSVICNISLWLFIRRKYLSFSAVKFIKPLPSYPGWIQDKLEDWSWMPELEVEFLGWVWGYSWYEKDFNLSNSFKNLIFNFCEIKNISSLCYLMT